MTQPQRESAIDLSVVIPCKNEERWISTCLDAILRHKATGSVREVIVVDNGSTDGTLDILASYEEKIRLFSRPGVSISELRNFGARQAEGEWIAFVDSDVEVGAEWAADAAKVLRDLARRGHDLSRIVTGSTYLIPESPTWVERVWFGQLVARDRNRTDYINGGNLFIRKKFFDETGGFRTEHLTGEDVRFCRDVIEHGGTVRKVAGIPAVHHGYPKTIGGFFRRERWHGLGMKHYLLKPWLMRDLVLALYFMAVTVLLLFGAFALRHPSWALGIWLAALVVPVFVFALLRSGKRLDHLLPLTFLYFVYGWARVFSLFDIARGAASGRKKSD